MSRGNGCEYLRAVGTLPPEGVVEPRICIVPDTHLVGNEILHSGFLHNLRHTIAVAENVGKPAGLGRYAEPLFGIANAVEELTDKALAGDDVTIRLNPHTADVFPATLFNSLLNLLEDVRIMNSHFLIHTCLALREDEVGILLHKAKHCCVSTADFTDELLVSPHINHIKVGVADKVELAHTLVVRVVVNSVIENLFAHSQLSLEYVKIRLVKVNVLESLFKRFADKGSIVVAHARHKECVVNCFQIPVNLVDFIVCCCDE